MRLLLLIGTLTNSVGTLALWVMLTPYFAQVSGDIGLVGFLASTRQFAFLAGSLLAAVWADRGRPLKNLIRIQCIELCLGMLLLFLIGIQGQSLAPAVFIGWCAARFLNSGFAFVFGFRVLARTTQSLGAGSIMHLAVTQGANVFGPLLTLALVKYSSLPFRDAIAVDVVSSILFLSVLISLKGSEYDTSLSGSRVSFTQGIRDGVLYFWSAEARPWNYIQILFLCASTGFVLSNQILSTRQETVSAETFFSSSMLIYGVVLWLAALFASKIKGIKLERIILMLGSLFLVLSGAALLLPDLPFSAFLSVVLWCLGFWCLLHLTNRMLLNQIDPSHAGRMRASMLFYLSVVFGLGEVFAGFLGRDPNALVYFGVQRSAGGFAILTVLTFSTAVMSKRASKK